MPTPISSPLPSTQRGEYAPFKELPLWAEARTVETSRAATEDDAVTDSSTWDTGMHSATHTPRPSSTNPMIEIKCHSDHHRRTSSLSINEPQPLSPPPIDSAYSTPNFVREVLLVRHGESLTNIPGASQHCFDPSLSSNGHSQCMDLAMRFADVGALLPCEELERLPMPHVVFTSPLTRALETATTIFRRDARNTTDLVCLEDLREVVGAGAIAEHRRSKQELSQQFPAVDFSCLHHNQDPFQELLEVDGVGLSLRCAGADAPPSLDAHDEEVRGLTLRASSLRAESSRGLRERAAKMLFFLLHTPPQVSPTPTHPPPVEPTPHAVVSHFHFLSFLVERLVCAQDEPSTPIADMLAATDRWSKRWPNAGLVKVRLHICSPRPNEAHLRRAEFHPMFPTL